MNDANLGFFLPYRRSDSVILAGRVGSASNVLLLMHENGTRFWISSEKGVSVVAFAVCMYPLQLQLYQVHLRAADTFSFTSKTCRCFEKDDIWPLKAPETPKQLESANTRFRRRE